METNELMLEAKDLNQQGLMLLKARNIEGAKEKFEKAIEIEPMLMDSYKNYGDLYLVSEEYEKAKNFYKKALLIEKSGEVYFQYGNACFMSDELHEGLEYYNLALSAGYDSDEMYFFMGLAYEHMDDQNMALRYIHKAIAKNPSRPDYKAKKALLLIEMGTLEEAEKTVDEMLLSDPEIYDGYHMKTMILVQKKEYEKAVEFSKDAAERFPEDAELLHDYAKTVALVGKMDDALKILEKAKKLKYYTEAKADFALLEAEINAEMGNIEQAVENCKECIACETDNEFNSEARFMLINLYLAQIQFEPALEQATAIVEQNKKDSFYFAALYYRPFCLRNLGNEEEAVRSYKEAISLYRMATLEDYEVLEAYLYRAMCLKDIEQYEEALEFLEFIESLSDEIAEVYTIRAEIYKSTGRNSLVATELEKAYKIRPELKNILGKESE